MYEALISNPHLGDNNLCTISGTTVQCQVQFNEDIFGHHLQFNASVSLTVNVANHSVLVRFEVDGEVIINKVYSLDQLMIPICVPIHNPIQLAANLCLKLTGLNWSKEKDCFKIEVGLALKVLMVKDIWLISPRPIGHNTDRC